MFILATKLRNRFSPDHIVQLRNIVINGDKRGCSGFIALGDQIVYVNTGTCGGFGYMYRTAKHMNDYTGGPNMWARDIDTLVNGVNNLLSA